MLYDEAYKNFRVQYWKDLLKEHDGCVIAMAKASGVHRSSVHKIVVELGFKQGKFGSGDIRYTHFRGKWQRFGRQLRLPMLYPLPWEL